MNILELKQLDKSFKLSSGQLSILEGINLNLEAGDTVALVGPSGSGKTTLLGLAAGLDSPSSGDVLLAGTSLTELSQDSISELRAATSGFIFQNFQLIPTLTAFENILVPAELLGKKAEREAKELLERVGLSQRSSHYPHQLSGGEQQRVALARAFINKPKILFADEPTGNLDEENAAKVEQLLFELNAEANTAMLIATHNLALAKRCERVFAVKQKGLSALHTSSKEQV